MPTKTKKPTKRDSSAKKPAARRPATPAKKATPRSAKPTTKPGKAAPSSAAPAAPPAARPVWVWHECVTGDVVGAKAFYTGLLGWTTQDVEMPTGPYTLFRKDGKDVGGCMAIPTENG